MYKVGYRDKEGNFIVLRHIEKKWQVIQFMHQNPQYDVHIKEINNKGKLNILKHKP